MEQEVTLPDTVLGFMLIKKLRLESAQESMILTATDGSMKLPDVMNRVKAIFADGKGSSNTKAKEVFLAGANWDAGDGQHGRGGDAGGFRKLRRSGSHEKKRACGFTSGASKVEVDWHSEWTVGAVEEPHLMPPFQEDGPLEA